MKFLQYILFLIITGLLLPCVVGAQNVSTWQEPYDSNDAGKSLRREGALNVLRTKGNDGMNPAVYIGVQGSNANEPQSKKML